VSVHGAEPLLPTRPPRRNHETAPFWDACAAGRLSIPRCDECAELIWYPRRFCPFCGSRSVTYTDVSGQGTVYTFTIMRRGGGPFREKAPYVLAYVRLDEGPVVMTNIVGVDPESVEIGQAVQVVFEPAGDGDAVPRFTPI
jgi:uncharacterized OB-fold protein